MINQTRSVEEIRIDKRHRQRHDPGDNELQFIKLSRQRQVQLGDGLWFLEVSHVVKQSLQQVVDKDDESSH